MISGAEAGTAAWRIARLVSVVVVAAGAMAGCWKKDDEPVKREGSPVTILSWNMCASVLKNCPYPGDSKAKVKAIVGSIGSHDASIVILQEACMTLKPLLEDALSSTLKQQWTVEFRPVYTKKPGTPEAEMCRDMKPSHQDPLAPRGQFGLITAFRGPASVITYGELPSPSGRERRVVMCMRQASPIKIHVCNAHFSTGGKGGDDPEGEFRIRQADLLQGLAVAGQQAGYVTFVGGDLNSRVSDSTFRKDDNGVTLSNAVPILERLIEGGGSRCVAGDDGIDYIFASENAYLENCSTSDSEYSDHDLLVGRYLVSSPVGGGVAGEIDVPCPADRDILMAVFEEDLSSQGFTPKVEKLCTRDYVAALSETLAGRVPLVYSLFDRRSGSLESVVDDLTSEARDSEYMGIPRCDLMEKREIPRKVRDFFGCSHWGDSGIQPTGKAEEIVANQRQLLAGFADGDPSMACSVIDEDDVIRLDRPELGGSCKGVAARLYSHMLDSVSLDELRVNLNSPLFVQAPEGLGISFVYIELESASSLRYLSAWSVDTVGKWRVWIG